MIQLPPSRTVEAGVHTSEEDNLTTTGTSGLLLQYIMVELIIFYAFCSIFCHRFRDLRKLKDCLWHHSTAIQCVDSVHPSSSIWLELENGTFQQLDLASTGASD